jgi:lysophosphatidate acyltransferase
MFPEGTRNGSATLLPFKKGAFHVAIASQTPIQPVVVSRYNFLDESKKLFNSGMYQINFSCLIIRMFITVFTRACHQTQDT